MTVAFDSPTRVHQGPGLVRARWWMHPEAPWVALTGAAWLVLAIRHLALHQAETDERWTFNAVWWTVMVVAMMVPGALPMQRGVVFDSLWRRRHRNGAIFMGAYLTVWIAVGVVPAVAVLATERLTETTFDPGRNVITAALGLAVVWQLSTAKARALRRCHFRRPFAPRGHKATRDLIGFGIAHARACVGACGPIMAAMFVAAHDFHLMVPLAVITVVERLRRVPPVRAGAVAIGAAAALTLIGYA